MGLSFFATDRVFLTQKKKQLKAIFNFFESMTKINKNSQKHKFMIKNYKTIDLYFKFMKFSFHFQVSLYLFYKFPTQLSPIIQSAHLLQFLIEYELKAYARTTFEFAAAGSLQLDHSSEKVTYPGFLFTVTKGIIMYPLR